MRDQAQDVLPIFRPVILRPLQRQRLRLICLILVILSAPVIHVAFALTLGWREYMPFLPWP